jgi:hypothetical protein
MPLSALKSTTASSKKAGFAKAVDASATMGANLARCASLPLSSDSAVQPIRLSYNLVYDDRLVFNGLAVVYV